MISKLAFSGLSEITNFLNISISPFSLFIKTLISLSWPNFDLAALAIPVSIEFIISSLSIDFSNATASAILKSSNLSALLFNILLLLPKKNGPEPIMIIQQCKCNILMFIFLSIKTI